MDAPLVSAILPTRGRVALAQRALDCWHAQTWPNKELIIYDDKEDKSFKDPNKAGSHGGTDRRIRYYPVPGRLTIGEKRNLCCTRSEGEYIVHFDSDDWSAPDRISDQMARILAGNKAVTGYHHLLFTSNDTNRWWRFEGPVFNNIPKGRFGVFGTSLLYRRDWWKKHRFVAGPQNFSNYEDGAFVKAAIQEDQLLEAPARDWMVARVHSDNSSPKGISGSQWVEVIGTPPVDWNTALKGLL